MTSSVNFRFVRIAAPPIPMLGSNSLRTFPRVDIANLGPNCTVSAFGVWGCPLLEETDYLRPLLVKANLSVRDVVFLFGMFDTTDCDLVVKFKWCEQIHLLYQRYYPERQLEDRLRELTTGSDLLDFGGIGLNALVYLVALLHESKRLVLRPNRITV